MDLLKSKKFYNFKIIVLILIIVIFQFCSQNKSDKPKNVIIMIGDGMGIPQITSGIYSSNKTLNFFRFKNIGLVTNHSYNKIVTDSAASATAIATGSKTYNKAISVDNEKKPLKTIMEIAKENGYNIGVVVTCSLTDATPAAFMAHEESRENQYEIARDILDLKPDLILGGGLKYFKNRPDNMDLIQEFSNNNYKVFYDWKELLNINLTDFNYKILGLFADSGLSPVVKTNSNKESYYHDYLKEVTNFDDVRSPEYLFMMTRKAIEYLESKNKPYILLIEGSQIDWGGHNMDSKYIINEVIDFDRAIGEAIDHAEKNHNTLLLVTADHETGGLNITGGDIKNQQPSFEFETKFIHSKHTSTMVPIFSYGPGAEDFMGIMDNTDIFRKIKKLLF